MFVFIACPSQSLLKYRKIPLIRPPVYKPSYAPQICNTINIPNISPTVYTPPKYKPTWINFGNINVNVICT